MNFEKYVELHILENQEGKVIEVDLYYHENESQEYDNFVNNISNGVMKSIPMPNENVIEFYHKNYIDYRGLIPKGLAIDCTNLNIY